MEQDSWGEVLDKNRRSLPQSSQVLLALAKPSPDILDSRAQQAEGTA